jgi:hypothetical protein
VQKVASARWLSYALLKSEFCPWEGQKKTKNLKLESHVCCSARRGPLSASRAARNLSRLESADTKQKLGDIFPIPAKRKRYFPDTSKNKQAKKPFSPPFPI